MSSEFLGNCDKFIRRTIHFSKINPDGFETYLRISYLGKAPCGGCVDYRPAVGGYYCAGGLDAEEAMANRHCGELQPIDSDFTDQIDYPYGSLVSDGKDKNLYGINRNLPPHPNIYPTIESDE